MTNFDLISDFHQEMNNDWEINREYDGIGKYYPWHLDKKSDVLVIDGDCSNDPRLTVKIVEEAADNYETVVFTDGNHDHYTGYKHSWATVGNNVRLFQELSRARSNIEYLDGNNAIRLGGVLFIGGNGWYDFTANRFFSRNMQHQFWRKDSNDSRCIRFDKNGYPDKLARRQAERMRVLVEQAQDDDTVEKIVCVTHTIPHRDCAFPDTHPLGYLNGAYINNAMEQVWLADQANKIKVWCFGHTHSLYDSDIEGIRFINNARGYLGEKRSTSFTGVVQVDLDSTAGVGDALAALLDEPS